MSFLNFEILNPFRNILSRACSNSNPTARPGYNRPTYMLQRGETSNCVGDIEHDERSLDSDRTEVATAVLPAEVLQTQSDKENKPTARGVTRRMENRRVSKSSGLAGSSGQQGETPSLGVVLAPKQGKSTPEEYEKSLNFKRPKALARIPGHPDIIDRTTSFYKETLATIFTANPDRPRETLMPRIILKGEKKITEPPTSDFQGCPSPDEESDANRIVDIITYSQKGTRVMFKVMFVNNDEPGWVDLTVLVKLEPQWIWKDYLRQLYVYHHRRRGVIKRKLDMQLLANAETIITSDIKEKVAEFTEARLLDYNRKSTSKYRDRQLAEQQAEQQAQRQLGKRAKADERPTKRKRVRKDAQQEA